MSIQFIDHVVKHVAGQVSRCMLRFVFDHQNSLLLIGLYHLHCHRVSLSGLLIVFSAAKILISDLVYIELLRFLPKKIEITQDVDLMKNLQFKVYGFLAFCICIFNKR